MCHVGRFYEENASCYGVVRRGDSLFQLSLATGRAQLLIRASRITPGLAPLGKIVMDQLQAHAEAQAAQVLPWETEGRLAGMMLQPEMVPAEATTLPEEDIDLDEVCRLLQAQAPDAAAASTPVEDTSALELLRTTALHGLPNFPNTSLHSMLRSVLAEIQRRSGPLPGNEEGRGLSNMLLAAFADCQQQQAATINRLYGTLSGRDATLEEKVRGGQLLLHARIGLRFTSQPGFSLTLFLLLFPFSFFNRYYSWLTPRNAASL
jgi:hypothetical protein